MKKSEMISPNFSLRELTRSDAATRLGLDNTPTAEIRAALKAVTVAILEPVRAQFGPVMVSSGYRSAEVNKAIKGSPRSQHMFGQAVDFEVPGVGNGKIAQWIKAHLDYDALILEFHDPKDPHSGWVHCSYVRGKNRKLNLTAERVDGKVVYSAAVWGGKA